MDWPLATLPLLAVAYRVPAYNDETTDYAALEVLANLAFGENSDLYQKLVIQEQKVDRLGADGGGQVDPGLFTVTARIKKPADVEDVRQRILATVAALRETPVDAARLDKVKGNLRYGFALGMDNSEAVAGVVARFVALRRTPETINKLYDLFARVTPEDVREVARKYLVDGGRTMVTLTGKAPGGAE